MSLPPRFHPPRAFLLLTLLAGAGAPLGAQEQAATPVVLGVAPSPRVTALGGSVPLWDRDPDLLFRSPGLLGRLRGLGVGGHRFPGGGRSFAMAAAAEWFGGGAALGLRSVTYQAPMGRRAGGSAEATLSLAGRERTGSEPLESLAETAVTAGYGRAYRGFHLGGALTGSELRRGAGKGSAAAVEVGVGRELFPFTVALSGGGSLRAPGFGSGFRSHPWWAAAGFASQPAPVGPLDLAGSALVTYRDGEGWIGAGGGEVRWWPVEGRTLVGRLGIGGPRIPGASDLSLGAGLLGDDLALEYAWRGTGGGGGLHALSLRFR